MQRKWEKRAACNFWTLRLTVPNSPITYNLSNFITGYRSLGDKIIEVLLYVYFVLIHTVVVVNTSWCWCLEGECLIYTTLDYLFHIVEYVVFPILDLREMLCFALLSFCWLKSFFDILMTILKFPHWRPLKQVIWFELGWGCRCNRVWTIRYAKAGKIPQVNKRLLLSPL